MTAAVESAGALARVPMPNRIRGLPRNRVGYPIPFFADTVNGERDFRVASPRAVEACVVDRACWICGQRRRRNENAFVIGPMCAINRTTSEPPSHLECAEYAAKVCPFLVRPNMVRRDRGLPEERFTPGIAIERNPGACLIWVVKDNQWSLYKATHGESGMLIDLGVPLTWSWWAHGRTATRAEVDEAIRTGMPLLENACQNDGDRAALQQQYQRAVRYLPTEENR